MVSERLPKGIHLPHFNEHIGVQPREPQFGASETSRVYEIEFPDFSIGVTCGDIASVPTEAVMCPTTPWLEIGGGAIENRLYEEIGEQVYDNYVRRLMELIKIMHQDRRAGRPEALRAADEFWQLMSEKFPEKNIRPDISNAEVCDNILRSSDYDKRAEHGTLLYGGTLPAPSGRLNNRGIKYVVLVNVTPQGTAMTPEDMSMFTENSIMAASWIKAKSITIPAVGTGFAAAFGFGLSLFDSFQGFFLGALAYKLADPTSSVKRIDYNIYTKASESNAREIKTRLVEPILSKLR